MFLKWEQVLAWKMCYSLENVPSPPSTTRNTRLSSAQSMQSKIRFFPDTNITLQ